MAANVFQGHLPWCQGKLNYALSNSVWEHNLCQSNRISVCILRFLSFYVRKTVSSNYFWERELVMLVWCCCGWTPAGGSTSHQTVCLIPIRKSVYHMRISPIVHCLFLCVSVCVFDRMSACVFPQGWVFNVIPWFVAIPSSLFSGCLSDHLISQGTKPHMLHKYSHHFSFKDMSSSCSCLFGRQ